MRGILDWDIVFYTSKELCFRAYTWEVLVLYGADHGECGVVGRSGLRGDLVLRGLGRREHLIQHHHSVFDGDLEKEKEEH